MPGNIGTIGSGPGGGLRFARNRGRTGEGQQVGLRYPSPFFDIAQTYLPTSVKNLFKWTRFYFLTNPLINSVITKMAEYPITGLSYDTKHENLKKKWKNILEESLDILSFLIGVGLDYYTYGNCFVSIAFPFRKYLKCRSCKESTIISKASYKFRNFQYLLVCEKCMAHGPAIVVDRPIRSLTGVKLLRWGPENIGINYNQITGETTHVYEMPMTMKNDILIGKPEIIERIPMQFIEALRLNRGIEFHKDSLFHLKRPNLAEQDQGWGIPLPMPVLKDTFYLQVLKKAQEAIAEQRIVPLEILFPQPSTSVGEPYGMTDLSNWATKVEEEIARWKFDPNHIPIMPLPIGHQLIGGDGRALLLHQEIRLWSEQIVIGMGVPIEFIFGGASWTGSNVSLRTIENLFLKYRRQQIRMIQWIVRRIATYMGWPIVDIHFTDFKMADDLQMKQTYLQLSQLNKISDRTLLDEFDLDYMSEKKQIEDQFRYDSEYQKQTMVAQAEAQGEAGVVSARFQQKIQEGQMGQMGQMSPDGQPVAEGKAGQNGNGNGNGKGKEDGLGGLPGSGVDARQVAMAYAKKLSRMPQGERQKVLSNLVQKYPHLAALVQQYLAEQSQQGQVGVAEAGPSQPNIAAPMTKPVAPLGGSAMKPLPQQKPPRRTAASV